MDYDKLWSMINKAGLTKSASANIVGMSHTGFVYMMERKTMTVEALEKFANYFNVPISSFFESGSEIASQFEHGKNTVEESPAIYSCSNCISKQKEIDALKMAIGALNELLDKYRREEK